MGNYKEIWLDIGCRSGDWVRKMAQRPEYLVVGIDTQRYSQWDSDRSENTSYVIADATKLPFKDGSIDHTYAKILGPFESDGIIQLARESQRVLREGKSRFSVNIGTALSMKN
jgi:ubiquinone/menaquinone biosynthesis C-methylase UbiE